MNGNCNTLINGDFETSINGDCSPKKLQELLRYPDLMTKAQMSTKW